MTLPATIAETIAWHARHRPEREAFRFLAGASSNETTLTFAALDEAAFGLARRLADECDDKPILLMTTSDAVSITALVACLYAGRTCVPIPKILRNQSAERVRAVARSCGARTLIAAGDVDVDAILPGLRLLVPTIAADGRPEAPVARENSIALIQYTSGSTSEPKGVALTNGNITANLEMLRAAFQVTDDSRFLSWLPLFHDMGLAMALMPLYFGVTGVLMPPLSFIQRPARWLKALGDHRATITGAPNFAFEACVRRLSDGDVSELDLGCCEIAFCGAEPVRLSTMRRFARRFAPAGLRASALYPCYGMAEATTFVTGGRLFASGAMPADAPNDANLLAPCGTPAEGSIVAIVDPDAARRRPDGEVGEVWIHGPHVANGYWNAPSATEAAFGARLDEHPGKLFVRTGDLGRMEGGVLTLTGRLKDVINQRGVKLHAADVEATVASCHRDFGDVGAAFAWMVDGQEELVVVQEQARKPAAAPDAAMLDAALDAVAYHHGARIYDLIVVRPGAVPRTTSGKVRRGEARDIYAAGGFNNLADGLIVPLGRLRAP